MTDPNQTMETRAAELGGRVLEWNELDFVGWKEFRRMAPAVVGLEITRLERVMHSHEPGSDVYNTLVRARFELRVFAEELGRAERSGLEERARHLERALLAIGLLSDGYDSLRYASRRLQYIHDRLKMIY